MIGPVLVLMQSGRFGNHHSPVSIFPLVNPDGTESMMSQVTEILNLHGYVADLEMHPIRGRILRSVFQIRKGHSTAELEEIVNRLDSYTTDG